MKRSLQIIGFSLALALALSNCTSTPTPALPPTATLFELTSSAFAVNATIPARHSCHGEKLSPPLAWNSSPAGTQSFMLILEDPDAVQVVGHVWDHWLVFNIPAAASSLPEGLPPDPELPDGSRQGQNSSNSLGYGSPCPPGGQTHRYVFTLYALDSVLDLEPGATKDEIMQASKGHILGQAKLSGLYTSP